MNQKKEKQILNGLICPVCKQKLNLDQKTYKCENNHCFDVSKYGVVNLSLNNKSSKKRHGDDKMMVVARKEFLDSGYYAPIQDTVVNLLKKHCKTGSTLLDAGCGEGYYTAAAAEALCAEAVFGIDISKDALRWFKKRMPTAMPIVSSIFKMPIADKSVDVVLNMFAPNPAEEFSRILKKDGFMIRTFVLRDHLIELKQAVYDKAYYNNVESAEVEGFRLIDSVKTEKLIHIEDENIKNLFCMTPYYYKTSKSDQLKLERLQSLDTTLQVMTGIYKKL